MEAFARAQTVGIFLGATLVGLVGVMDDGGLLHHQVKLFLGMPGAALILIASGVRMEFFETFRPGTNATIADCFLTVFFVVGITASFSIFDHMDGLCAGVAAIASFFFAVYAYWEGHALDFQARQDFYGRWRSDVPWLPDGHAGGEDALRKYASPHQLDCPLAHSWR